MFGIEERSISDSSKLKTKMATLKLTPTKQAQSM
jgi:hypothetical protein